MLSLHCIRDILLRSSSYFPTILSTGLKSRPSQTESANMTTLQNVKILAVFLLCQQAFVESEVEECSGEAEYSISGMMLRRHIFKKITGAHLGNVCLRECYLDVRCQSFNYVISKETCELNNRTKEARPKDFVPNSDRYYFKRDKDRGILNRNIEFINSSNS